MGLQDRKGFPEPPGLAHLRFFQNLLEGIAKLPGVDRVRHRLGNFHEKNIDIAKTMIRVTPRVVLSSLTIVAGFVAMITSRHYPMEFLGWSVIVGMLSAVPLTLAWSSKSRSAQKPYWSRLDRIDLTVWWLHSG